MTVLCNGKVKLTWKTSGKAVEQGDQSVKDNLICRDLFSFLNHSISI